MLVMVLVLKVWCKDGIDSGGGAQDFGTGVGWYEKFGDFDYSIDSGGWWCCVATHLSAPLTTLVSPAGAEWNGVVVLTSQMDDDHTVAVDINSSMEQSRDEIFRCDSLEITEWYFSVM